MSAQTPLISDAAHSNTLQPAPLHDHPLMDEHHPVPAILQGPVNIYALTQDQRRGLLQGPVTDIYLGSKYVGFIRTRAGVAISPIFNQFWKQHSEAGMIFPDAAANKEALQTVIHWFTFKYLGGETVRNLPWGKSMVQAIRIYQAALLLGLDRHISQVIGYIHRCIKREELLTYKELDVLLATVTPEDRFFKHVSSHYASLRFKGKIPDPETFEKFVNAHPDFADAMADVDNRHAARREFYANKRENKLVRLENEKKKKEEQRLARDEEAKKVREDKKAREDKKRKAAEAKAKKAAKQPAPAVGMTRSKEAADRARAFWSEFN